MRAIQAFIIFAFLIPFATSVSAEEEYTSGELIDMLKEGGLVVYIRHGSTESDYADQITADPSESLVRKAGMRLFISGMHSNFTISLSATL
jgi:hypothetical protein